MNAAERCIALDARNTHVTFLATLGPLQVRGRFTSVTGELCVPAADIERASVSIDVLASSVDTGLAMRDRHLRGVSFLDSAHAPLISYRSERVSRENGTILVEGCLSLRGVERPLVTCFPIAWAESQGMAGSLSLSGELSVSRHHFAIGVPRGLDVLNPIFLVMGEEVRVRVEVVVPATRLLPALLPALGR